MDESRPSRSTSGEQARYSSLHDYFGVVRRRWILITIVTLAFAGASLGLALSQAPRYEAEALLSFRDLAQDFNIFGVVTFPEQTADIRAASNAELITSADVTKRVKRQLGTGLSTEALQGAVSARVGTQTQFVILEASASDPDFAAKLANAYARQARVVGGQSQLRQIEAAESSIAQELEDLRKQGADPESNVQYLNLQQSLTRLQTLKSIARPVEISERAQVPSAPVSPQPKRSTVLGGFVGFMLGLLLAFLRDSLDRRLRTPHEAHEELQVPVLGRVPESAFGYPGLAANGAVAMPESDFEAFRVLRMNLGFFTSDRPIRSIVVTSPLPGEGKSTVSMSLASAAVLAGQRVLLVECDLRRPCFASRLRVAPTPGLTDYLMGQAKPQDILQTVELVDPEGTAGAASRRANGGPMPSDADAMASPAPMSLVCVTAGTAVRNGAELLVSDRFRGFLHKVTKAYDLVVVDTSPMLSVVDSLELIPQVESVLLCVRVEQTTRDEARAAKAALSRLPERPIGAVVTGVSRKGPDSYDYYYGY